MERPLRLCAALACTVLIAACNGGVLTGGPSNGPHRNIFLSPLSSATTEAGAQATFTIVLATQPDHDVTLHFQSSDVTEGLVNTTAMTFTRTNWNAPQTVVCTGVDDLTDDGDQIWSVHFLPTESQDSGYAQIVPTDVPVTNVDDETAGITVSAVSGATTEAGGQSHFTVVLNSQPTADVTVSLDSDDATEGTVDKTSLTFTAANWNAPQLVTITGVNDAVADGDQTYSVSFLPTQSNDARYSGATPQPIPVTNIDDEIPGILVSPPSGPTTEAGGTATFSVVLRSQPSNGVTVHLDSSVQAEGTVSATSLPFTTTNWNVPQTVTVSGVNDDVADGNQLYSIAFTATTSADPKYAGLVPSSIPMTNLDDETAGIRVSAISGPTSEATGTATFTIVLQSKPSSGVSIPFTSNDLGEGTVAGSPVSFTTTDWNVPKTVTVTGVNDDEADGNQPYAIVFGASSSSDAKYNGLTPMNVAVTNLDDDSAALRVSAISGPTTEAGGTATFSVVLGSKPSSAVTVPFSTTNAAEGTVAVGSVGFSTSNWNVPQNVTVTGADDRVADGNVPYAIAFSPSSSADPAYSGITPANVNVTNVDDDRAGFVVSPISGPTTEGGGTATFTVELSSQPAGVASVTLTFHSDDATEGSVSPTTLTFLNGAWNVPQTVTVRGVDDATIDGNVAYHVVFDPSASADPVYSNVTPAGVAVTNVDDDAVSAVPPIFDLVVGAGTNVSGEVSILHGNGDGSFTGRTDYPTATGPSYATTTDLRGNGTLDLLALSGTPPPVLAVFLGDGSGGFAPRTDVSLPGSNNSSNFAIGDFNGDGKADVVTADMNSPTITVLLGNGSGGFGAPTQFGTGGSFPIGVAVGDFNGDGKLDVATGNNNSKNVSILLGTGTGSFGSPALFASGANGTQFVAAANLRGIPGRLDLVVTDSSSGKIDVLLGAGNGTFGARTEFTVGAADGNLAIADLNGDGKLDVAVTNYSANTVSVLLGAGDGSFGTKVDFVTGSAPSFVAIGDLDRDGIPDLAVTNYLSNTVSVLLGNGDGSFRAKTDFATGASPNSVSIAPATTSAPPSGCADGGWAAKTNVPKALYAPSAAANDGVLYVVAGQSSTGDESALYAYHPTTNSWTTLASMPGARHNGDGAAFINGKMYVVGGWSGIPTNSLFIYDPVANTWSSGASMPHLAACGSVGVINGKLYATTSCNGNSGYFDLFDVYDPVTNAWTSLAGAPHTHGATPAAGVIAGKLYVAGGTDAAGANQPGWLDVYDPVTNTWTTKATMPTGRYDTEGAVHDGRFYVAGGIDSTNNATSVVEVYDPASDSWTTDTPLRAANRAFAMAAMDGILYTAGGAPSSGLSAELSAFTPCPQGNWVAHASFSTNTSTPAAGTWQGKIDVIGGYDGTSYLNFNDQYDVAADAWTSKTAMPTTRNQLAYATVNGITYVIGGSTGACTNAVEAYDPATNAWSAKAGMPTARCWPTATALDGKIYVMGGSQTSGAVYQTLEVYDVATNTWSTKANMPTARSQLGSAAVDGKIYAVGGYNGALLSTVEVYDPIANTWTSGPSLQYPRTYVAAVARDGKVWALGGYDGVNVQATTEWFDPRTNVWSFGPSMLAPRSSHAAVVLDDTIWVLGGNDGTGSVRTVESLAP